MKYLIPHNQPGKISRARRNAIVLAMYAVAMFTFHIGLAIVLCLLALIGELFAIIGNALMWPSTRVYGPIKWIKGDEGE